MRRRSLNLSKDDFYRVTDAYLIGFRAERNKKILEDFEIKGMTYEEIAAEYDMSVSQIKQIVKKSIEYLKEQLSKETV